MNSVRINTLLVWSAPLDPSSTSGPQNLDIAVVSTTTSPEYSLKSVSQPSLHGCLR
jgi:hypothetical protein